jgi:hypothetical protein
MKQIEINDGSIKSYDMILFNRDTVVLLRLFEL